jgi:hypothetical protein
LFRFRLLRKGYAEANIPEFSEHTDLATLETEYERFVRQLRIDSKISNYKKYLTMGFKMMEWFLVEVMHMPDAEGYTQNQIVNMNEYDKVLIEIGEKSSFDASSQWSPELRLVWAICINTAMFVGSRMMFKVAGDKILNSPGSGGGQPDFMNMFSNMASQMQGPPKAAQNTHNPNKPRMRGPDFDDLSSFKKTN